MSDVRLPESKSLIMDSVKDIEMPSPKRQRTDSPSEARQQERAADRKDGPTPAPDRAMEEDAKPEAHTQDVSILDTLMQHVESEAEARRDNSDMAQDDIASKPHPNATLEPATNENVVHPAREEMTEKAVQAKNFVSDAEEVMLCQPALKGSESVKVSTLDQEGQTAASEDLQRIPETPAQDHMPPVTETGAVEQKEWQTDSSPYSSSTDSSDDSSDSSEDDSDDDQNDYQMLDPFEQARILMADAGSDDEDGNSKKASGPGAGLRTANEKVEQVNPKPDIEVTESMTVEELGHIENIVEHTLLIRAKTSGEYQVLESNSLLCLENRKVIGVVAETLGRVEQPLYTVRFASQADIDESGVSEKGTKIFYVKDHSTFVFTQPLKGMKGSDASNFHDEEVGDDEMEFSDDEAEAEHKRNLKLRRKGIDPADAPLRGRGRGRGGRGRGGFSTTLPPLPEKRGIYDDRQTPMNYDEMDAAPDMADGYTPLQRPSGLVTTGNEGLADHSPNPPQPASHQSYSNADRGAHRPRGRGRGSFPDHNRGGRRGHGHGHPQSGRTNFNHPNNHNTSSANQNSYTTNQHYLNSNPNHAQPPQHQQRQQQQPPPPQPLNPYSQAPQTFALQYPLPSLPPLPPAAASSHMTSQNAAVYPGNMYAPGAASMPTPMMGLQGMPFGNFQFGQLQQQQYPAFGQGLHQNQTQNQNQNQYQQQSGYDNSAAMAQVQRQLDDLRRQGGQYP